MKIRTLTGIARATVDDILDNGQRCIVVRESDKCTRGEILRIVSNEPTPNARCDVFRVITHLESVAEFTVLSLRPLSMYEKAALKSPDSAV